MTRLVDSQSHKASVAFIYNYDFNLYRFRGSLIQELLDRGYEVHGITPRGEYASRLERMGVKFHHWNVDPNTMNPIREVVPFLSLVRLLRSLRPSLVHTFTIKPNFFGVLAARTAGVPAIVSSYTGLGYLFIDGSIRASGAQRILRPGIRMCSRICDAVTFQNADDLAEMVNMGLVPKQKARLISGGSGVNIQEFSPESVSQETKSKMRRDLGISEKCVIVSYIGRMLHNKGVNELVACSQAWKGGSDELKFLLVGGTDDKNPRAIPLSQLKDWEQQGLITYLGHREDIVNLLAVSDLVVLPSYREGVPRVLLEASAMGKAIITTDSIGCREVVDHQVNGLLVNQRNALELVEAVKHLASDEGLRTKYGQAAREKAVREFDERLVINATISLYNEVLPGTSKEAVTIERPG